MGLCSLLVRESKACEELDEVSCRSLAETCTFRVGRLLDYAHMHAAYNGYLLVHGFDRAGVNGEAGNVIGGEVHHLFTGPAERLYTARATFVEAENKRPFSMQSAQSLQATWGSSMMAISSILVGRPR